MSDHPGQSSPKNPVRPLKPNPLLALMLPLGSFPSTDPYSAPCLEFLPCLAIFGGQPHLCPQCKTQLQWSLHQSLWSPWIKSAILLFVTLNHIVSLLRAWQSIHAFRMQRSLMNNYWNLGIEIKKIKIVYTVQGRHIIGLKPNIKKNPFINIQVSWN